MDEDTVRRLTRLALAGSLRELAVRSNAGVTAEDDGLLLYATGPRDPALFNGALRIEGRLKATEALRRAGRFFSGLGRSYALWALDGDHDVEVAARAAGLHLAADFAEMVLAGPLAPAPWPTGVDVRLVAAAWGVPEARAVLAQAFASVGVPPEVWDDLWPDIDSLAAPHIATVVGELHGRPVASAMAVVSGEAAQVLNVGTVPWARGRGLGEAVTRAAVATAFDRGAGLVALQATPMGERLYRRLGFVEVGRSRCYVAPGQA